MLDFLGIGAQKAGTTWLYSMLSAHPQVCFPADKEVHFWNLHYDRGLGWYRELFDGPAEEDVKRGEITPAYGILSRERVEEIHAEFPRLRALYLIRNPIDRAWSSALMALGRAEMSIDEASDQWFLDHFNSLGSLQRGDYEACIRTWTSVYPKEQLLVLRYESIHEEPRALLRQVALHLSIQSDFFDALSDDVLKRRVFPGMGHPLRATLRPELERIYSAKIQSLGNYLATDLGWSTPLPGSRS